MSLAAQVHDRSRRAERRAAAANISSASQRPALVLDKEKVSIPCPRGYLSPDPEPLDRVLSIGVSARGLRSADLKKLRFSVSGGKVVVDGSAVKWDLRDVAPGTYTITASAAGSPKTRLIEIEPAVIYVCQSTCTGDCFCPCLEVMTKRPAVEPYETVEFTALLEPLPADAEFLWKVDGGTIIAGQRTSKITVRPNPRAAALTAVVSVKWHDVCFHICPSTASGSVVIK